MEQFNDDQFGVDVDPGISFPDRMPEEVTGDGTVFRNRPDKAPADPVPGPTGSKSLDMEDKYCEYILALGTIREILEAWDAGRVDRVREILNAHERV